MRSKRTLSLIVLLLMVMAPLLIITVWGRQPDKVDETSGKNRILFVADERLIWPGQCTTLRWDIDSTYEIRLDETVIGNRGETSVCPSNSTGYILRLVDKTNHDDIQYQSSIYVRIPLTTRKSQLLVVAYAVFIGLSAAVIAYIGYLPWLTRWIRHPTQTRTWAALRRVRVYFYAAWKRLVSVEQIRRDLYHIFALVLVAAVPLVFLRYVPEAHEPVVIGLVILVFLALLTSWAVRSNHSIEQDEAKKRVSLYKSDKGLQTFSWSLAISVTLLICVIAGFYTPMRDQFWMGGDEPHVLQDGIDGWHVMERYDGMYSRPLTPLGSIVAVQFTPNSVKSFLWLAFVLRFLSAALIFGIVVLLRPKFQLIAVAAAFLFIINPSEPTRYLAVYMQGYNVAVFLMLLSLYLFLRSYVSNNRLLLLIACVLLACSFLVVETGFPLSLLWPLLLWLALKRRQHAAVWIFAWFVTVSLLAVRLLQFYFVSASSGNRAYQESLVEDQFDITSIGSNFLNQLEPVLRYFQVFKGSYADWFYGLALLGIVAAILFNVGSTQHVRSGRRPYRDWLVGVFVAIVLSIVPYLALEGILSTFRTQFFAAPAQAVGLAVLIGLVGTLFSPRGARLWISGITGAIVMISVVAGLNWQSHRPINPDVQYEKTARIIQQVVQIAPDVVPDTVLIFVVKDGDATPLGWNYYVINLSLNLLETEGYQVEYEDSLGVKLHLDVLGKIDCLEYPECWYSRLIIFEIAADGRVKLLEHLPDALKPDEKLDTYSYNPRARIRMTPKRTIRFFQ